MLILALIRHSRHDDIRYLNSHTVLNSHHKFTSNSQKAPKMKFVHMLVVIFVTLLQGTNCHSSHRVKISSQMHLNAIEYYSEYIMACERTQRFELPIDLVRNEKLKKKSEITTTKKTKKKDAMKEIRNRIKWHYYDLFLF